MTGLHSSPNLNSFDGCFCQDALSFELRVARPGKRDDQFYRRELLDSEAGNCTLPEDVTGTSKNTVHYAECTETVAINFPRTINVQDLIHSQPLPLCDDDHQITSAGTFSNYFEAFQKIPLRTASCANSAHSTNATCGHPGVAA